MKITWSPLHKPYTKPVVNKYAPSSAGVYLLLVKLKKGDWKCFYVGKALDLKKRLLDHLLDSEENECIKNYVASYNCGFMFAKVSKTSDRDGIEKFLYDYYVPKCNKKDPGGTPIKVNLP